MKLRNMFAAMLVMGSANAMAVVKPSIAPLLGTYKGDCSSKMGEEKFIDATELKIEQDNKNIKLTFSSSRFQSKNEVSLEAGKEIVEIDNLTNTKTTTLLKIEGPQLRQWTMTTKTTNTEDSGFDMTETAALDFSNSSSLKLKTKSALGGEVTFSSNCTLEKMNMRIK